MEDGLRFVPSRVDGHPDVREVAVFPDRLQLRAADKWVSFPFAAMAQWPRPTWFWRLVGCFGWRPHYLMVGERDWFHPPAERFFRFYTSPSVVVYMPDECDQTNYMNTWFWRVQEVMYRGGYNTWDLG